MTVVKVIAMEDRGRAMQEWIEQECSPLGKDVSTTVTSRETLQKKTWKRKVLPKDVPEHIFEAVAELGIPTNLEEWSNVLYLEYLERDASTASLKNRNQFVGLVGPKTMIIENVKRSNGPHASQVALDFWKAFSELESPEHIFMVNVCHRETRLLVQDELYAAANNLSWPQYSKMVWERGTSGYEALLGTTLGRIVGYFVLEGYGRGQYRVARIVTWESRSPKDKLQMRFDIEKIPATDNSNDNDVQMGDALSQAGGWNSGNDDDRMSL